MFDRLFFSFEVGFLQIIHKIPAGLCYNTVIEKYRQVFVLKRLISLSLCILLLISLCAMGFCSCSAGSLYSLGDGELEVVVTVFPAFDLAREVGGEKVRLTLLQDRGTDMHSYTPTGATLEALKTADVFIYIGGVSDEAWVHDAIEASGNEELISLCLIDTVEQIHAETENDWSSHPHSHDEGEDDHSSAHGDHAGHDHSGDEHIWLSLRNAVRMVGAIESVFSLADEKNTDYYRGRAGEFCEKLSSLDRSYSELFEGKEIPRVVFADRFPFVYLFHDYHIPYIAAFSGCSTEVSASFETQISLIEAYRDSSLGFILTIEGESKAYARSVASDTGALIRSLDSMQSVSRSDIESGVTYLGIMQDNLNVLSEVFS